MDGCIAAVPELWRGANRVLPSFCLLASLLLTPSAAIADDAEQFFESAIRPLLVEHCIACHGAEKQSGGLRLDSRGAILKGGESGAAMTPGDAAGSRVVQATRYDGDLQMPPEKRLSESQIHALQRWVELGSPWPNSVKPLRAAAVDARQTHWAFQPVHQPEVPEAGTAMVRTPVDAFVIEKLLDAGLNMSPEADRRTLIRRVSYSLTGLPPSPEEVEHFIDDPDPQSYAHLVDRLLASPAHGEHWARHWLDVARYSDTKGYVYAREERFWIHAWSYRDWVVKALNADMPYDRFLLLQLAADQVTDRSDEDLAAMGFLTLGRRFQGVRRDIIDDRIDVVCRGTMALTVGCARCHDHKYDPIPTADYYSLYGVFDSCRERVVGLSNLAGDVAFDKDLATRMEALDKLRQERRETTSAKVRSRLADYLGAQRELQKYPEEGFDQVLEPGDLLPAFVHRWRDYLRDADRRNDPVFAAWHRFAKLPESEFASLSVAESQAIRELPSEQINARVAAAFATAPASFDDVVQRYAKIFAEVDQLWQTQVAKAGTDGRVIPDRLADDADEKLRRLLYGPGSLCEVPDEPIVQIEYDVDSGVCNELWKLQGEVDRAILGAASQPRFAVIIEDREFPTEPRIFKRGNSANRGDDIPRQFLALLGGENRQPFQHGSGRLEMAHAIISPSNPLTARVIVNRVWAHHFGAGLVTSVGDFGTRAEPPSHPELLDWLTSKFIADGWSLRKLHRLIVLSAAYRQSSQGLGDSAALLHAQTVDPANRLLWRMNVHRLSFEELRDSMLAVAGQLNLNQGGKPTELFTPPFPVRRTLYGLVDRQFLPGTLRMFDFANPDLHIPQRSETTVPQQSLFLMNHPLALEQSRKLAALVSAGKPTATNEEDHLKEIVRQLFRRVYQRDATAAQLADALQLLPSEGPETESPAATIADWSYGFGAFDESSQRVAEFARLPHFTGAAWQGGAAWPDAKLGWVQLTGTGGHPGDDRLHASVRRWTAPAKMTLTIQSEVMHEPEAGDGIRVFIVSSRTGLLQSSKVHHQTIAMNVDSISVEPGETIDFVVDIGDILNSDQHFWRSTLTTTSADHVTSWNSETDFPRSTTERLTPLEQLAQALLCSNELMFVD